MAIATVIAGRRCPHDGGARGVVGVRAGVSGAGTVGLPARSRAAGPRRGPPYPSPSTGVTRAAGSAPRGRSRVGGRAAARLGRPERFRAAPAGAHADWWTRADAAAALAVAAGATATTAPSARGCVARADPPAAPWLEMLELSATFGAAGRGSPRFSCRRPRSWRSPRCPWWRTARAPSGTRSRGASPRALLERASSARGGKPASLVSAADVASAAANERFVDRDANSRTVDAAVDKGVGAIKRDLAVLEAASPSRGESRSRARDGPVAGRPVGERVRCARRSPDRSRACSPRTWRRRAWTRARRSICSRGSSRSRGGDGAAGRRDKDEVAFGSASGGDGGEPGEEPREAPRKRRRRRRECFGVVRERRAPPRASSELTAQSLEALARARAAARRERGGARGGGGKSFVIRVVCQKRRRVRRRSRRSRRSRPVPLRGREAGLGSGRCWARLTQLEEAAAAAAAEAAAGGQSRRARARGGARGYPQRQRRWRRRRRRRSRRRRLGQDEDWDKKKTGTRRATFPSSVGRRIEGRPSVGLPFEFANASPCPRPAAASAFGRIAARRR